MVDQELLKFVIKQKDLGIPNAKIVEDLSRHGWAINDIQECLKYLESDKNNSDTPQPSL